MFSEYVFVVDDSTVIKDGSIYDYEINNNVKVVNVNINLFIKKKVVNEKLIEYFFDLEYVFDELNFIF